MEPALCCHIGRSASDNDAAMMVRVKELEEKNEELRRKMSDLLDETKKDQENLLEVIRDRDKEILRLNLLLAEKTGTSNSTAAEPPNRIPEKLSPSPVQLAKDTSKAIKHKKRSQFSEEANVPCSSSPEEANVLCSSSPGDEARELGSSRVHTCANMYHMLLESLVHMKISLNKETEDFWFSAYHENTGYSFTLKWLKQRKEWSYTVSSLGSLERVAPGWMKEEITFSNDMCRVFFQRISDAIKKAS